MTERVFLMSKLLIGFKSECILTGLIIVSFAVSSAISINTVNLSLGILTAILGILIMKRDHNHPIYLKITNNLSKLLLTFIFPVTLLTSICLLSSLIIENSYLNGIVMTCILIIFGILLLPFIKIVLLSQSQVGWQIAGSIALMTGFLSSLNALHFSKISFDSNIDSPVFWTFALASFTIAIYAMHSWGYRLPRFKINSQVNYWWLLLTVITLLLNMGLSAGSWTRLFTHFDLITSPIPLPFIIYTIIWIGLKEEFIFRYLFLWPLASIEGKTVISRVFWASLISALFFGLYHAQNLTHQNVLQTFLQIFAAFGIGFLFSIIALYTGTIWISVVIHCMIDLIGFPIHNSGVFSGSGSLFLVEFIVITRIIELIVGFLLLKDKSNQRAFSETLARLQNNKSSLSEQRVLH